jgi:hypothetical protein
MAIEFEVLLHAVENGAPAYDRRVQFRLDDFAPAIELSQRLVESAARGFHGIANPTPTDLANVMCGELFHLLREEDTSDKRRIAFIAGSLIRLCALPEDALHFRGLGRHPAPGETLRLSLMRQALGDDRYSHSCSIEAAPAPAGPLN